MTKSLYADRETVGAISVKARQVNERVTAGDMAHEFMEGFVEDLNKAIASNPFDDRPFYITIHEKKDLVLKNCLLRRIIPTIFRPYPEPNCTVFWANPKTDEIKFCWSLPHKTLFQQYIVNASKYRKDQIKHILAYQMERMEVFGFYKHGVSDKGVNIYFPIEGFKDQDLPATNTLGKRKVICPAA